MKAPLATAQQSDVQAYMELEYSDLEPGTSRSSQLCPVCKGGRTGEKSLSVTRLVDGKLLWKCHRNSCGRRGSTGRSKTKPPTAKIQARSVLGRQIIRGADTLPEEVAEYLQNKYGLNEQHLSSAELGWTKWNENDERLVIPVKGYNQELKGCILRSLNGTDPKVISHTERGAIAWFVNHTSSRCIIVEDAISAIRVSAYLTSVALLGTYLSNDMVDEIKASNLSPVLLALDKDAFASTINYVRKYRSIIDIRPIRLDVDIKDMTTYRFEEFIKKVIND